MRRSHKKTAAIWQYACGMRPLVLASLIVLIGCKAEEVPTPDVCRESWYCPSYGLCTTLGPRCVAAQDSDCAAAADCERRGTCRAVDHFCSPVAAERNACRALGSGRHDWCGEEGRCSVVSGLCVALTTDDCSGSRYCRDFGLCTPWEGICVRGATTDAQCSEPGGSSRYDPCASDGRCVARDGRCVVGSDEHCRGADACRTSGACSHHEGRCISTTQPDCERSEICERDGACVLRHGSCQATDEICAARPRCREHPASCKVQDGVCAGDNLIDFQF